MEKTDYAHWLAQPSWWLYIHIILIFPILILLSLSFHLCHGFYFYCIDLYIEQKLFFQFTSGCHMYCMHRNNLGKCCPWRNCWTCDVGHPSKSLKQKDLKKKKNPEGKSANGETQELKLWIIYHQYPQQSWKPSCWNGNNLCSL